MLHPRILLAAALTVAALAACGQPGGTGVDVEVQVATTAGGPRQGLPVHVAGANETTDATGTAVFADVETPYDVTVRRQTLPILVHAFRDLSDASPGLVLADTVFEALAPALAPVTNPRRASVPVPVGVPAADQYWIACLESGEAPLHGCVRIGPTTPAPYEIEAFWYGPATLDAKLHAVLVQTTGGLPTSFPAYRVGEVPGLTTGPAPAPTLSPGGPLAAQSATVTVLPPSTLQGVSVSALVRVSEALVLPVVTGLPVAPGASTTLALPHLGDGRIQLVGRAVAFPCLVPPFCTARAVRWETNVAAGADVTLELPTPPTILQPPQDADDVGVGTTLEVSSTLDGVVTFVLADVETLVAPNLAVSTLDASTTVPDPSVVQAALPAQDTYLFFAIVVPGASSPASWLDAFGPLTVAERSGGPGTNQDGSLAITPWRRVRTP